MKTREARLKCVVKARMRLDGVWSDVCIRDISTRGMLLQAALAPRRGKYVEVYRGRHVVVARVVWSTDHRFGIHTQDRLNVRTILGEPDLSTNNYNEKIMTRLSLERRSKKRDQADLQWKAERSRLISKAGEFATIGIAIAATGYILSSIIFEALSGPLATVSATLS